MERGPRVFNRYSLAFQQKVVSEIECGALKIGDAQRIYDIKGAETIQRWIRKLGKNHLLNKVVRIEMKDEKEKIRELEKHVKTLESALAQSHVKNIALESLLECAQEHYQTDFKKTFGGKELGKGRKEEQA
jgi:transposase-like protein